MPDRRAPPVGANLSALSLSLSLLCGVDLSAPFLFPVPALSLSVLPSPPVSHPQPPTHDPPSWTRPRPRILRPRTRACAPFEPHALLAHLPSLIYALSRAPSLSLCARDQRTPPPLTVGRCPFCDHRRAAPVLCLGEFC